MDETTVAEQDELNKEAEENSDKHKAKNAKDNSKNKTTDLGLSREAIEVLLMGVVAYWGDGKIVKEEMDILLEFYRSNRKKLNFVSLTDPEDESLSEKEFIIGLCEFLKSEEERLQDDPIELPKEFVSRNKKKIKNKELTSKDRLFIFLTEELGQIYHSEYEVDKSKKEKKKGLENRSISMIKFQKKLEELAKADGNFEQDERQLIELMNYETKTPTWVWIFWLVILGLILKQCMD